MSRAIAFAATLLYACAASAQPAPGETILVGRAMDGAKANGDVMGGSVNRTGALILFLSTATNLHPQVTDAAEPQLYRKDLRTGEIRLVSIAPDGRLGTGVSIGFLSPNGRYAVFSAKKLLAEDDTRDKHDTYWCDLQTGDVKLVGKTAAGVQQNGLCYGGFNRVTPDGRYVAFVSTATNLDPLVTAPNQGHLYVKDMQTGSVTLVDTKSSGQLNSGYVFSPAISDDGKRVAFLTNGGLVAEDDATSWDAYLTDLTDGSVMLLSTSADGTKQNRQVQELSATPDLRFVAFSSNANNLVAGDLNRRYDAFRKDTRTGEVRLISTATDGSQGNQLSFSGHLSEDGRFATFWSASDNLVPNDTNEQRDSFVKDMLTGECLRISIGSDGTQLQNFAAYPEGISGNGSIVTFSSNANLPGLFTPYYKTFARNTGMISGEPTLISLLPVDLFIGKKATLTAKLIDKTSRENLAGQVVTFMADSKVLGTSTTNTYGVAKFVWSVPEGFVLGEHEIFATFGGTVEHARSDVEATATAYPGPVTLVVSNKEKAAGQKVVLTATLKNASGEPLSGREVTFAIDGADVDTATTDANGVAKLEYVIPIGTSTGAHELKARFAGDTSHTGKTAVATLTVT